MPCGNRGTSSVMLISEIGNYCNNTPRSRSSVVVLLSSFFLGILFRVIGTHQGGSKILLGLLVVHQKKVCTHHQVSVVDMIYRIRWHAEYSATRFAYLAQDTVSRSSIILSLTGAAQDCTMNTSLPRRFSLIWIDTSPSAKRFKSASARGTPISLEISFDKSMCALPVIKTILSKEIVSLLAFLPDFWEEDTETNAGCWLTRLLSVPFAKQGDRTASMHASDAAAVKAVRTPKNVRLI